MEPTTEEPKVKKAGRPPKTKPVTDMTTVSKFDKKEEKKEEKEKEKKLDKKPDKKETPDNKLKDSLKQLEKVATSNKKEITAINKKIDNIIKKIKD